MNVSVGGKTFDLTQIAKYAPAIKQARKLVRKSTPAQEDYVSAAAAISKAAGSPIDLTDQDHFLDSVKKLAAANGVKDFNPEPIVDSVKDLATGEAISQKQFLSKAPDILAQSGIPKVSEAAAVFSLLMDDEGDADQAPSKPQVQDNDRDRRTARRGHNKRGG